jgi:hypothetical protein
MISPNKQFTAPSFYFTIDHEMISLQKNFLTGFLLHLDITEWDAIKSVNDFSFALKRNFLKMGR